MEALQYTHPDARTLIDGGDILRRHIDWLATCERSFGSATALREHGRIFDSSKEIPYWLRLGGRKQCYRNAASYALVRDDVYYAEGYALDPKLPVPIEHAWLVSSLGTVIDPTWEDSRGYVYFGIAFRCDFLTQTLAENVGEPGILSNIHRLREGRPGELLKAAFADAVVRPEATRMLPFGG